MKEVEVAEIGGGKEELAADWTERGGGGIGHRGEGERLVFRVETMESGLGRRRGSLVVGFIEGAGLPPGVNEDHSLSDGCTKWQVLGLGQPLPMTVPSFL